jgi:excinuclease ABC subunit C
MCSAPCAGKIIAEEYNKQVRKFKEFLNGEIKQLIEELEKEMKRLSELLEFEKAANIRDLILGIRNIFEPQFVVFNEDLDVDGIFFKKGVGEVLRIRNGNLLGKLSFEFNGEPEDFLRQLYFGLKLSIPEIILTNFKTESEISKTFGTNYVGKPRNDFEIKILELSRLNWEEEYRKIEDTENALNRLKEILELPHLPRRIEGIDISHTQGLFTVASLVVFVDGKPMKNEYRRYRFDSINSPDDFLSIKKVVIRRYQKYDLPDLLFIDGGKGQVNSAVEALKSIGKSCPVVGIAKEDERIVFPGAKTDLKLPLDDIALRLLIKVRDESHRFANSFHSKLRDKRIVESKLDNIPGIGPKRKKALLKRFGSVEKVRNASINEIKEVVKSEKLAVLIKKNL